MKQYSNTSSLSRHSLIAISPPRYRFHTIASSRNCAIAPSSLHCRAILLSSFIMSFALSNYRFIAIELLLHRHRTIAYRCKIDSAMIDAIVNYMAPPDSIILWWTCFKIRSFRRRLYWLFTVGLRPWILIWIGRV